MGIDDAIARANEAEEQERAGRGEQHGFEAKARQVIDELYQDFVQRVKRAGVQPQKVVTTRPRSFFMRWLNGEVVVDTGQRAWVLYWTTQSEQLSSNPWLAVTESGTKILVHIGTDKHSSVLRRLDIQPEDPIYSYPQRQPWVDAEEFEKEALKKIADETSDILAAALKRLGAA